MGEPSASKAASLGPIPHIPQPFTRAHAEAFVELNMTEPCETLPTFAVVLDDHVIGTVNVHIDPASDSAMLGYAIARAHWGRGITVEAATAAIAEHDLIEVWASTMKAHTRSRRVMEKLGMTYDGCDEREGALPAPARSSIGLISRSS